MKDLVQSDPIVSAIGRTSEWIGKTSIFAAWGVKGLAFIGVTLVNDALTVILTTTSIIYMGIKIFNEYQVYRKSKSK